MDFSVPGIMLLFRNVLIVLFFGMVLSGYVNIFTNITLFVFVFGLLIDVIIMQYYLSEVGSITTA